MLFNDAVLVTRAVQIGGVSGALHRGPRTLVFFLLRSFYFLVIKQNKNLELQIILF
jgi:hypothetical protein